MDEQGLQEPRAVPTNIKPERELYTVTPWSALLYCSSAFGLAVTVASVVSYRRGVRRLQLEGITDEEAAKALPYAFQAFGIATSMVAGVGIVGAAGLSALGLDIKSESQISSVREALGLFRVIEVAQPIAQRCRAFAEKHLWSISDQRDVSRGTQQQADAIMDELKTWSEQAPVVTPVSGRDPDVVSISGLTGESPGLSPEKPRRWWRW